MKTPKQTLVGRVQRPRVRNSATKSAQGDATALPHERDEAPDPLGGRVPHPDPVGLRAKADIDKGLVDTDRSLPMDATYRRQR